MVVAACCHNLSDIPADLRRCFTHEIAAEAPDAAMRGRLLQVCQTCPANSWPASSHALPRCNGPHVCQSMHVSAIVHSGLKDRLLLMS